MNGFPVSSAPAVPPAGNHDPGDFAALLQTRGLYPSAVLPSAHGHAGAIPTQTQATTILALKFAGGVLVAGDRRATAGNIVVYDRADKVLEIDRHSVMAIAGVPGHGVGDGARAGAFVPVLPPHPAPGDEYERQGPCALEAPAG